MYRYALIVVACLAVTGCLAGPGPSGPADASPEPTATPTASPAPTASPTARTSPPDSPEASPGSPEPDRGEEFPEGPKEPPERPATLNRTTAAEYVESYEYRYAYNTLWANEYSAVSLECEVRSAEEAGAGYDVVVACTGSSNTGGPATGTATATVIHADWFTQVYRYRVTEDSLTGFPVERGG